MKKQPKIYRDESLGANDELFKVAIDAWEKGEVPVHPHPEQPGRIRTPLPEIRSWPIPEAARIKQSDAECDEILYTRFSTREKKSNPEWKAVAKFYPDVFGPHRIIKVRPFMLQLDAQTIAALEACYGREFTNATPRQTAEQVELEKAAVKINPNNGSWIPLVKYRGQWFGCCKPLPRSTRRASTAADREIQRRRERGAPDIAIV